MSHYIPLTETEQDVLRRMVEGQDLYVEVKGWGFHPSPQITVGDKRMQIRFPMELVKPEGFYIPVYQFHLLLKNRAGKTLVSKIESTVVDYKPLSVTAGMTIDLVWDLAFEALPPELIRMVLPKTDARVVAVRKG